MADPQSKTASLAGAPRKSADATAEVAERLGVPSRRGGERSEKPSRRNKLVDGIKTLLWVLPLTLLIWIYAEREQRVPYTMNVQLSVRSGSADRIARIVDPDNRRVELTLTGPRASIEHVRDELAEGRVGGLEILIEEYTPGEYPLNVAEAMNRSELLRREAVTVERATPSIMRVSVEAREVKRREVEPDRRIYGKVQFEPPIVEISGPKKLLDSLAPEQLAPVANMSKFQDKGPGKYEEEVSLHLKLGAQENVFLPRTVRAIVEIESSRTATLQTVPIRVSFPLTAVEDLDYKLRFSPSTLTGVVVKGPPDVINALAADPGKPQVLVEIPMNEDQLADGKELQVMIRPEWYKLPAGVTVENPGQTVTITVTAR